MHATLRSIAALATFTIAAHALAAPAPILPRSAALQCEGRKVELQSDCFSYIDEVLACTRQKLTFSDAATSKKLNVRTFKAGPKEEGDDYPIVEEKFSTLSCVETGDKEKYVVATMRNGGNCKSCEWHDVYTLDGVLAGTDRDRKKKNKVVTDAVDAVYDKKANHVLGKNVLIDFYFLREK
jgi:hypothetical protein